VGVFAGRVGRPSGEKLRSNDLNFNKGQSRDLVGVFAGRHGGRPKIKWDKCRT
jgi:hypothetical protein